MDTVAVVRYKLRILSGISRDVFYQMIWPYIPEPPDGPAPDYEIMEIRNWDTLPFYTNIYDIPRIWSINVNGTMRLFDDSTDQQPCICCLCEKNTKGSLVDVQEHRICLYCADLIEDRPNFFK